jgi:hypothetical protein
VTRREPCPRCLEIVDPALLVPLGAQRVCPACGHPGGSLARRLVADMRHWCRGRSAWIRVPVLIYLAYVGWRYAIQPLHPDPAAAYVSWFDGINLGFHELGHVVFRAFGRFLHILGGTLLQCLMPVAAGFFLLRQRDYFGVAFCLGWLSTNLSGVAVYMADANTRTLPLVAPGVGRVDASYHDWFNLLGDLGWLDHAERLAVLLKVVAATTMLATLALGGWLCLTMVGQAASASRTRRR